MSWYRAGHTVERLEARILLTASTENQSAVSGMAPGALVVADDDSILERCAETTSCGVVEGQVSLDLTADGFSADDPPHGDIVVELYLDEGDGRFDDATDSLIDTQTSDAATGQYRFDPISDGLYFVREVILAGFTRTAGPEHYSILVHGGAVFAVADAAVDDFRLPNPADALFVDALNDDPALLQQSGLAGVAGGERDILLDVMGAASPLSASVLVGSDGGQGVFSFGSATPGASITLQYDGVDTDDAGPPAALVNSHGLEHDLTDGGASSGLLFALDRIDPGAGVTLAWEIRATSGGATAVFAGSLDASVTATAGFVPFASFAAEAGFSFAAVDSLEIVFNPQGVANVDFELSMITTATPREDGFDFGNHQPQAGTIRGVKYLDENANGVRDALAGEGQTVLEPGLGGVRIYLDLNDNSELDPEEPVVETGTDGTYEFVDIVPGAYVVREVLVDGFVQTRPGEPTFAHVVTIIDGEIVDHVDFGNVALPIVSLVDAETVVEGDSVEFIVTLDRPAIVAIELTFQTSDGTALSGDDYQARTDTITIEAGASGATILVETNDDEQVEDQESFSLRIVSAVGATVDGEADTAQALIDDNDEPPLGSIVGRKWLDRDGDRQQDEDEPGLPGVTIYLDLNNNAVLDGEEPSTVTSEDGGYRFDELSPGTYFVREQAPDGFMQTFPSSGSGAAHMVALVAGEMADGVNFGNQENSTPPSGPGSISGSVFSDEDGDGTQDAGEGNMPGVIVYLDLNGNMLLDPGEPSTITDDGGNYRIDDLSAGTYIVREVLPSASVQTLPGVAGGFGHTAIVSADGEVTDVDFGNQLTFGPENDPPTPVPQVETPVGFLLVPERAVTKPNEAGAREQPRLSRDGGGDMVKQSSARNIALVQLAEMLFIDPAIEEELDALLVVLADATAPDLLGIDPGDPPEKPPAPGGLDPLSSLPDPADPPPFTPKVVENGPNWWVAAIFSALASVALVWRYRTPLVRQIKALLA